MATETQELIESYRDEADATFDEREHLIATWEKARAALRGVLDSEEIDTLFGPIQAYRTSLSERFLALRRKIDALSPIEGDGD